MNMKKQALYLWLITILSTTNSCTQNTKPTSFKHVQGAEQVIVYSQEGRFAAWPANNGAWLLEGMKYLWGLQRLLTN